MKSICIIPARGGSKRIKKKNIKIFFGKPILQWTYETIRKSKIFDKIVLTSDSDEVLNIGKKIGFDILIKRPKKLSNDYVGTVPVIKHAINYLSHQFILTKKICCIYPCNPFIHEKDLNKANKLVSKNLNNFVYAITNYSHPVDHHGGDFFGGEGLGLAPEADLQKGAAAILRDDLERPAHHAHLDRSIVKPAADEALGVENGVGCIR